MDERVLWIGSHETLAGLNFDSVFVPRIGTEVVVQYLHGDIDCPVITGQDSSANHRGVRKGMHTESFNDDSNRMNSDAIAA